MELSGITRPGSPKPVVNPGEHAPLAVHNKVFVEVHGPGEDGQIQQKFRREHIGNIMATFGLNNLCERVATGGEASDWVAAHRIGTSTTAESSTHDSLIASTASLALSGASLAVSDKGAQTVEYQATYASNNPAGAYSLNEVGLFVNSTANSQAVARSVLGTDSAAVGASDEVRISHQIIFTTA